MLPAMKKAWDPQDCPLYRHADGSDATWLSGRLVNTLVDELASKEEYAFLFEDSELEELVAQWDL